MRFKQHVIIDRIIIAMFRFLFSIRNKLTQRQNKVKSILILSYFNLGDIICDSPSMRALRSSYPEHHIVCLVRDSIHKELLETCPYINEVYIIYSEYRNTIKDYYVLLKQLSRYDFDCSFQLVRHYGQMRKSFIPYILKINKRYGLWDPRRKEFEKCYTESVLINSNRCRRDEAIAVVSASGISVNDSSTECWYSKMDVYSLKQKLSILGSNNLNIIIHLGGTDTQKRWNVNNFASVVKKLDQAFNCNFILTGVESEHDTINKFKEKFYRGNVYDICGKLTIFELFALIKQVDLVVTNDTGPLHFSIALHTKVVAIFGPTPPSYAIGVYDEDLVRIIRGTTVCDKKNCLLYHLEENIKKKSREIKDTVCDSNYMVCVDKVTVDQVYHACIDLLNRSYNKWDL